MEHGLDARHARLLPPRPGPPHATTTTSSPSACSTPSPRTSSCRSPTTRSCTARARCSRRCRATAGSSSPTCARSTATCGRTPARSCCSWAASSRRSRSGATSAASTGTCSSAPSHARRAGARARPQPPLPRRAGALGASTSTRRLPLAGGRTTPPRTCSRSRASRRRRRGALVCVVQLLAGRRAHGLPHRPPRGGRWREVLNTDAARLRRLRTSATSARVAAEEHAVARPAVLGRGDAAAARRRLARPGGRADRCWPGRPVPARGDLGRRGDELLALLRERRARRALPVRRRRPRDAASSCAERTAFNWHGYLPASARASATATASTGRTHPSAGHRFNPAKLADRPVREGDRGRRSTGTRRSVLPVRARAARTPTSSPTTRTTRPRSRSAS